MNSCINFNSKDFKNFVKSTGLEESYAGYFVSKIQNRLNLQEMPTIDILLKHYNSISDAQCQVFQKDVFETVYSLYEWNQNYGHSISEEDVDRIFENLTKLGYRGMYKYKNTDGTFGITILKPFMDNSVLNGVNFEEYHTKRNARPITVDAYQKFINNEVNHDALLGSTFSIDNTWGKLVDKYESKYDIKIKGKKTKLDKHDNRLKYKVTEVTDLRVSKFLKSINNNDLVNSDLPITYQHYNFSVESGKITLEEVIAANSVINDKSPIDKDLQNRIFNICKKLGIEYYLDPKLGKSGTSIGNKIYINPNRLDYRTILHESIHAVTSYYISLSDTELSRQPKYIQKAVSNIKTLHKELWDSWISKQDEEKLNIESMPPDVLQDYLYNNGVYFLYSPNELMAELSYEGTKKFINDYSKSKKENFFSRLWETVLSFFRGESKQYHNLEKSLETLLSNYNDSLFNEIENTLEAKNLPDSNITLTEEQQKNINTISNKNRFGSWETLVEQDVLMPIGTSGSGKSTWIKSLPNLSNYIIISPDEMRVEFTGDMNNKSKDDEIYKEAAKRAIEAIKQGKKVIFDTTNLKKDRRTAFTDSIYAEIPNAKIAYKLMPLNAELAKQRIKADIESGKNRANVSPETIDRHAASYPKMLEDIKSEKPIVIETDNISKVITTNQLSGPDTTINIYAGTNENADLSNFAERPFVVKGTTIGEGTYTNFSFPTVEHAFQAAKVSYADISDVDREEWVEKIRTAKTPAEAKRLGGQIPGLNLKEWDMYSSGIMKDLLRASFVQNPQALQKLLSTGNATLTHIQDRGKWGTEFPRILMEVREELRDTAAINQQEIEKFNEKPAPIISPEITPLIETDGNFNIEEDDTEKSLSEKLTYALNSRTIKPGDIIDVTSVKDPNLMIKLIKFLKKQTNHYIFEYDDGPESFNKLPEEWQRTLKENNINIIPKFSYLFTRQEIKIREEEDNIINSELLKPSDLLEYSKTAALQFSKALQALKTIPEANEYYFGDKYKDYSFIGNTTEEILNKVGLAYALDEIIKEGIFNPDNNDAVLDNNTLVDKLSLIYDNFRGFVNLSYDQFLNIEGISIEDTSYGYAIENANVENRQSLESEEDVDSIAIAEEQGSVLEHWQIGFRSVSVHQSMSQQLRSYLNTLLDLDENGLAKYNELGFPKTINPVSVVDTILRLTQGSESLNKKDSNGKYEKTSMVYKLRQYTKTYPYLKQLVDNYYPDGDPANTPIEGLLISGSPQVEQLQSLFYTSIQRNHQLYNILFNDNGNTRLKSINKDTYTQKLIDTLSDSLNNKEIGMLNSYDFKNKKWKTEKAKELKSSISTLAQNLSKNPYVDNKVYVPLQNALSFLNIEIQNTDILQSLIANTPISQLQKKVIDPIWYILKDISDNGDDISYNLLNNKNRSNYKLLSAWLSPIMVTEMQSMFYQDGKSYYSFVLPSYITKTVKKLKGETANWDDYMNKNYGNIGWFRTENGGYLNYWLELIENNNKVRDNLEHSVLLSDYGVGYGDKTAAEYMSSIIASYFYNDNSDYALFRVGLLSNKPSEEYLKFQKITKNYEKEIVDKLFQYTFTQEVNRILAVKERKKAAIRGDELKKKFDSNTITDEELSEWDKTNRFTSNNLVSNLDSNGDKFHFLDFLNDDIENNTELGKKLKKYLNGDSSIEDMSDLPELLKDRIKNAIEKEYNVFKKACVDNLVFTVDENGNYKTTDVATLKNLNLKDNTKLNEERLREFFYNDYFAQVNMTQLFITDLALYKNTEDLQKRLAQLHAPSMKPNTEATINGEKISDGKFRTFYIKDSVIESKSVTNGLKLAVQNILKQLEDEGVSKNSIKYKQLKARLNNIVDAFSEVNWADAQGYTSPTAYRKRMAMFGKWSEREERAYKQLKEKGKISIEDLDILWQPLKPFGYSQVSIDGHNSYIPQFKIGIQNKNSEYLLIMADALLKGGKQNSKLSAIMDIMEESYDLDSTKGIDTIQFESTVKVGKRSVIDINNLKTAIDVKKALKEALYINGGYNPEYVNEYDFEDYGIQQEVPAHFEGRQQQGSQVRILSISDIACVDKNGKDKYITVNGETMTIREAKQNYMKAIADNINTSMEELARIFKLGHSKIEKNKALSDLIRAEIMRDSKYSPDLLWACSLNNAGEFNIPLSDPIHSVQIQQLLNSIIKNRIWKQKIAGGPVVQVSSFGLSEDLQVEYNEDGTVKCFQAYVPIYDENLIRDFMNEEGEVDIEKIKNSNPKLLEMMGYRIPTESKYSMVPIKVVGFLPRNAGEGIMLPAEITTLSGSDFDIDKLYIMRYEWDRDIDNEEVGILKKMIESEFDEKINSSDIREYFLGNENVIQNLNIKKLLDSFRYKAVKYNEPRNKRASNNNKIIDYSLTFLTSQYTLEQFITPGNFDSVKKIGYKIAAVKNNNDVEYNDLNDKTVDEIKEKAYTKQSLLYAHTQMSFYKQNSVAAKLIGAFAQANVSHAYVNTHCDLTKQPAQIFIGIKDRDGNVVSGSGFTINGYSFEGWQSLDPEYEMALGNEYATTPYLYDGDNRVSSYLASLLAASVDAVKDPVLNLMNINMDTVNVLVTLLRLGVDLETSALFLSHPAVVDLTKKGGFKDGGFILDDQLSNLSKFNTNSFTVNKEFLKEELSRSKENANISDIKNRDYVVLSTLQEIINVGKDVMKVTSATRYNSISSGVGPYATDTIVQEIKTDDFSSNGNLSNGITNILRANNEKGNPILGSIYESAYSTVYGVFGSNNFLQSSLSMFSALKKLKDVLGYLNTDVAKKFADYYVSINQIADPEHSTINPSDENRDYMLNDFPLIFKDLKADYLKSYNNNLLLESIMTDTDNLGNPILTLKTRGLSNDRIKELKNSWYELWKNDKDLAFALIEYNFFRGGFTYSPKTFMHLLSDNIKLELPNYIYNLKNSIFNLEMPDNIIDQFLILYDLINKKANTEEELKDRQQSLAGDSYEIVKFGNDYVKITNSTIIPLPNLGGHNQAFEADPSRAVADMKSVIRKREQPLLHNEIEEVPDNSRSPKPPIDYIAKLLGEDYDKDSEVVLSKLKSTVSKASIQTMLIKAGMSGTQIEELQDRLTFALTNAKDLNIEQIQNIFNDFSNILTNLNMCN